jgi:hypothetical protein
VGPVSGRPWLAPVQGKRAVPVIKNAIETYTQLLKEMKVSADKGAVEFEIDNSLLQKLLATSLSGGFPTTAKPPPKYFQLFESGYFEYEYNTISQSFNVTLKIPKEVVEGLGTADKFLQALLDDLVAPAALGKTTAQVKKDHMILMLHLLYYMSEKILTEEGFLS